MISWVNNLKDAFKRSLWAIPLTMIVLGLVLSVLLYQLDWFLWDKQVPFIGQAWGVDIEGIRTLFANISAAIITAMTTILSITLLIFTVLSGQYGAHILRTFKIRAFSKFVIGWFSGTYIYIIYSIYKMTTNSGSSYIPQISVTIGACLTLITLILLIFYVHYLVRQIQAGTVISEIAEELYDSISGLKKWEKDYPDGSEIFLPEELDLLSRPVAYDRKGYIQGIDKGALKDIAEDNGIVIKVLYRSGHFIMTGVAPLIVYAREEISQALRSKLRSCFITGEKRIPVEDLECNLELLVEMALKALSPGINDVMVANHCIDFVGESVALLVTREFPRNKFYSKDGKLLAIFHEFSFQGYLNAAFNPIRQYAIDHCSVLIRLLDILIAIFQITESADYKSVISDHFYAIYQSAIDRHKNTPDEASFTKRRDAFLSLSSRATE